MLHPPGQLKVACARYELNPTTCHLSGILKPAAICLHDLDHLCHVVACNALAAACLKRQCECTDFVVKAGLT
jgi:hypothetical protein